MSPLGSENMLQLLGRREIGFPLNSRSSFKKGVENVLNQRIQKNVAEDIFAAYSLTFEAKIDSYSHRNNYIAVKSGNQISLYCMRLKKRMWVCPLPEDRYRYQLGGFFNNSEKLIVGKRGVVLYFTGHKDKGYYNEIFFQGKRTGVISLNGRIKSSQIINDNIIILFKSSEHDDGIISIWDQQGNCVKKIFLPDFPNEDRYPERRRDINYSTGNLEYEPSEGYSEFGCLDCQEAILSNDDFYVALPEFSRHGLIVSLNLVTKETNNSILDIPISSNFHISTTFLFGKYLYCGLYQEELNGREQTHINPKIIKFDVNEGKVEDTYFPELFPGNITKIVANDDHIVFITNVDSSRGFSQKVCYIEAKTRTQWEVGQFSFGFTLWEDPFDLNGDILSISHYPSFGYLDSCNHLERFVYDLSTRKRLRKIRYRRYNRNFEDPLKDGRLVMRTCIDNIPHNSAKTLYIEDFSSSDINRDLNFGWRV